VVVNLVTASEQDMAGLIRPGGVLDTTASPAQDHLERHVRAMRMRVRSNADALATIVDRVDAGVLRVDVSGDYPRSEIGLVHQQSVGE